MAALPCSAGLDHVSPWNAPTSIFPSRCSFDARLRAPLASTVPGWQVEQSWIDIDGACGAVAGGRPWQLAQSSVGSDVHAGEPAAPWQAVVQVAPSYEAVIPRALASAPKAKSTC